MMATPFPARQDAGPFEDRRLHPRISVALPAFLQAAGERHSVQILDLSRGGAKLNCALSLASGTAVTLDCGTLGRGATVRWQDGSFLGIAFDSELNTRDMSALSDRSTALAALMETRDK
jgi:hypothetical protein